jgi:3-hydroxyisobutyrate dehydrogenase
LEAGFIGLGSLGSRLVERMVASSNLTSLSLFDVNGAALSAFAGTRAEQASSVADIARNGCDVVGVCVQNDAQLCEVIAGEQGLLAAPMKIGSVVAVHSTVRPDTCIALAQEAEAVGVTLLDAPVTNGRKSGPGVIPTTRVVTVIVGGDEAVFESMRLYFESFADITEYAGPVGSGEVVKLFNNLLVIVNMAMAAEVLAAGMKLNLRDEVLSRTLSTGSGYSGGLAVLLDGERAAHNTVILAKDLDLALHLLDGGRVASPLLRAAGRAGVVALKEAANDHEAATDRVTSA